MDWSPASGPAAAAARRLGIVSNVGSPVVAEGRLWGAMVVASTDELLPAGTEGRLEKFTELLATAIANAESRSELAASRRRIVAASDEARRRIERDLHDRTQQRLVSLGLAARAAEADVRTGRGRPGSLSGPDREIGRRRGRTAGEAAGKPSAIPSHEAGDPGLSGKAQDGLIGSPRYGREQDSCRKQADYRDHGGPPAVGRTHLAITVELVHSSHTGDLWPRPGRVLIASRSATFEQLATAIDDAFARWDRNYLHEFTLTDGTVITPHRWWDGEEPDRSLDGAKTRLGRLRLSEQFAYVFDLGDNWQHGCTVGPKLVDPLESLGTVPDGPLPCWGWGDVPDQYGRRWNGDDGSTPMPPAPDGMADLLPILPWWGPQPSRGRQASLPSGEVIEIRYRDLIT